MKLSTHLRISSIPYGGFILKRLQQLQGIVGTDAVIQGSYNTTNIGDLAIGSTIQTELSKLGFQSHLNGFINDYRGHVPRFKNYDWHIIGGGGVLRDYPAGYLETRLLPIGTARKGSIVLGVGFDGLRTERGKRTIKKLEQCAFITVRDYQSKHNLERFIPDTEIEVAACPAFLLPPKRTQIILDTHQPIIGVNLTNFYEHAPGWGAYAYYPYKIDLRETRMRYLHYVRDVLKPELKRLTHEFNIVFIPFAQEDVAFAKQALRDIPMRILPLQPPQETLNTIQKVDRMICMRYHSLIFSILAEIPIFIISYQNKTRELGEKLESVTLMDFRDSEEVPVDFTIGRAELQKHKLALIESAKNNFHFFTER